MCQIDNFYNTIHFTYNNMTLTQLEYIIAVQDYGTFSRAAEHCFVTQPTLSMQIQKLEEELGVIIFDRTKKPIRATPVGAEIIEQARHNIRGMARIEDIVHEQDREIRGQLRIGIIPTLAPYLLPLFITSFLEKYPQVSLTVDEYISGEIVHRLKQNWLDGGILVTPLEDAAIREIPLFYERFFAYVSTKDPLIRGDAINLDQLDPNEMLLLSEGHCFRQQVIRMCPEAVKGEWKGQLRFTSGSLETLKRIVEQDYGYTLLPELALMNISGKNRKRIRRLMDPVPVREVSLIVHRDVLKRNLINAFRDQLLEDIPDGLKKNPAENIVSWI